MAINKWNELHDITRCLVKAWTVKYKISFSHGTENPINRPYDNSSQKNVTYISYDIMLFLFIQAHFMKIMCAISVWFVVNYMKLPKTL